MKHCLILLFLICSTAPVWAGSTLGNNDSKQVPHHLPENYQQFKHHFLHQSTEDMQKPLSVGQFRGQDDYTMLYVSGGIVAITGGLAYLNSLRNNGGVFATGNAGILIGGGISATVFLAKYFVDRYR